MSTDPELNKSTLAPIDIARETFKQLAVRRVVPTPDNYALIYNEIVGDEPPQTLADAMQKVLQNLPYDTTEQRKFVSRWKKLLSQKNWEQLPNLMRECMDLSVNFSRQWPDAIRQLLKAWETNQVGLDTKTKKENLERTLIKFGSDPTLAQKLQNLSQTWMDYKTPSSVPIDVLASEDAEIKEAQFSSAIASSETLQNSPQTSSSSLIVDNGVFNKTPDPFKQNFDVLHQLLLQAIKYGLIPRLDGYPELQENATDIYKQADNAKRLKDWESLASHFRSLMLKVELIGANENGLKGDLLRLLKLLIDNVSELVDDDQWLRGQVAVVQTVISSPLDRESLVSAEASLKEVIYKQGLVKNSLSEAKSSFKSMVTTFVDRLADMSDTTGNYETEVSEFSRKISETDDIIVIHNLLENLMLETQSMQSDIVRSREDLMLHKEMVEASQAKVSALEAELSSVSEQVRVDQLTGVLNRRGMNEAMERELSRADRTGDALCVTLLDIDNFKKLNDNYGHDVGDEALKHLATVVKEEVRPTDIVTRFGGEEFVILLPNTDLHEALISVRRLQRALTKRYFLGNNEQLLITFSAGISLYKNTESAADLIHRADQAMFLAKKSGKNKTMTETDLMVETLDENE